MSHLVQSFSERDLDLISRSIDLGDLQAGRAEKVVSGLMELGQTLPAAKRADTPWTFLADTALSGMPTYCMHWNCRLRRTVDAAAFAALFLDNLTLFNPVQSLIPPNNWNGKASPELLNEVAFAALQIETMRPLIEAGLITYAPFDPANLCSDCLSKLIGSAPSETGAINPYAEAYNVARDGASVKYRGKQNDGWHEFEVFAPNLSSTDPTIYNFLKRLPKGFGSLKIGELLTSVQIEKGKFLRAQAHYKSAEIVAKSKLAKELGIKSIMGDGLEIAAMKRSFGADFIVGSFNFDFPMIASRNLERVLSIRENEWHHFEKFRGVFFDIFSDPSLDKKELEKAFQHKILPELTFIQGKIESAHSKARSDFWDNVGISAMSLGASILSAPMSGYLAGAVALLGGGHFAKEMIPAFRGMMAEPVDARDSKAYYLWKVKRSLNANA